MSSLNLHKNSIGSGIYTLTDVSSILKIPLRRISKYVKTYFDERVGSKLFHETYSWKGNERNVLVNFYLLIELQICFELQKLGVHPRKIIKTREHLAKEFNTPYPFASKKILTDGNKIWFTLNDQIITADGKLQTVFQSFINDFCRKIIFNKEDLAIELYPQGSDNSIVINPHHQFGQPTIKSTNVCIEMIHQLILGGESEKAISILYDIDAKAIQDVKEYYKVAA